MNNEIREKVNNSYLFGSIKHKDQLRFYLMPVAYWILNHKMYNPEYNPDEWEYVFRDNILNVDDEKIDQFLNAIEIDRIDINLIDDSYYNLSEIFLFFIDFDSKTFISYFDDINIEEYLPNDTWVGKFENPISYLPPDIFLRLGAG